MIRRRSSSERVSPAIGLAAVIVVYVVWSWATGTSNVPPGTASDVVAGDAAIGEAYRAHRSDIVLEGAGTVDRLLADDNDGSRHQRFILRLDSGLTLLVAHNIDLAPRVPLAVGDRVAFRGEYVWTDRGGVLHWTHHDPDGRRPGGWIRHRERAYE